MTEETTEQAEMRVKDAKAAHAKWFDGAKITASQVETFASDAMKAPALVGLGGVVALLGFYSANFERLSKDAAAMEAFGDMLFWLFTSLVLTVSAPGFAYLSQIAYAAQLHYQEHHLYEPFVRSTRGSKVFGLIGDFWRWSAVALIVGSIACLIRSGFLFFSIVG